MYICTIYKAHLIILSESHMEYKFKGNAKGGKMLSCYQDTCLVLGHHHAVMIAVVLTGQAPH